MRSYFAHALELALPLALALALDLPVFPSFSCSLTYMFMPREATCHPAAASLPIFRNCVCAGPWLLAYQSDRYLLEARCSAEG